MVQRLTSIQVLIVIVSIIMVSCAENSQTPTESDEIAVARPMAVELLDVASLSTHYVELRFSARIENDLDNLALAETYIIADTQGNLLPIQRARLSEDRLSVVLTTAPQQEIDYELIVGGDADRSRRFAGSRVLEPFLSSAVATDSTTLVLTFSEPMARDDVEDSTAYTIVEPPLEITYVEQDDDGKTVHISTAPQEVRAYTVVVENVRSAVPGRFINPGRSALTFFGNASANRNDDDDQNIIAVLLQDSDNDGLSDLEELDEGMDPFDSTDGPDIDGDGLFNGEDPDVDGDGIPNGEDLDVDGDGMRNSRDHDIDNDGLRNTIDRDDDGDGIPDDEDDDDDADGEPDDDEEEAEEDDSESEEDDSTEEDEEEAEGDDSTEEDDSEADEADDAASEAEEDDSETEDDSTEEDDSGGEDDSTEEDDSIPNG